MDRRRPLRRLPAEVRDRTPTPLPIEAKSAPIPIDPLVKEGRFPALRTLGRLARFACARTALRLRGRLDEETDALMTRALLERLGGMWIKLGQLLSLRSDLISPAKARALAGLQYQARGFPPEVAVRVIEEDLGAPLSRAFSYFERQPFAAASICQVHRATLLRDNKAVVVKVMRPDVVGIFARDLKIFRRLVKALMFLGLFKRYRLEQAVVELSGLLVEETNYRYEAVNLKQMRKVLHRHGVYVPRVIARLCGARMLVMEEVRGVLMSQYIRMREDDPDRLHRWALLNGIDPDEVAERLSITTLRQILEDNHFHGDLHPGNIILLADSRFALIDFGSVGRLDQRTWFLYRQSLAALAVRDFDRAADCMLLLSGSTPTVDSRTLRAEITATLEAHEFASHFRDAKYYDRSIAAMSNGVARVMARHQMPLSWGLMRVGRTLSTLDASLQTLAPDGDFLRFTRAYFRDQARRRRTRRGQAELLGALAQSAQSFVGDVRILMGSGLREQSLRLHGIIDRAARVRLVMLRLIGRGIKITIGLALVAFYVDEYFYYLPKHELSLTENILKDIKHAVPNLNYVGWLLIVILFYFLLRGTVNLARALRRTD